MRLILSVIAVALTLLAGCSEPGSNLAGSSSSAIASGTCDSTQHETSSIGAAYSFDLGCAISYFQAAGCDFTLDPNGDGSKISSSTLEDMFNDAASCMNGVRCSGCNDGDSLATVSDCTGFAAFSHFSSAGWQDMQAQCPAVALPSAGTAGCDIEGVSFDADEVACAQQFITDMTCDECTDLFDARICEDAFNDPSACQSGSSCTGCADGDTRDDGVTCSELAGYSYFGPSAAQILLDEVQANPCNGSCTPSCGGMACGDDGCGGSCGTCSSGESCDSAGQCQAVGCTIEGVVFDTDEASCAIQYIQTMDCASCRQVLDSRTCEDAINDASSCQVGWACTGCADGDTRDDGADCAEIAAYSYLGPSSANALLGFVQADPTCGASGLVIEGVPLTVTQAAEILVCANGASLAQLDQGAGLDSRAAGNIIAAQPIATIQDLADISYVGTTVIQKLRDYAPGWVPASQAPTAVTVQVLADEAANAGTSSAFYGEPVAVARAIVTSFPTSTSSGMYFEIADPAAGNVQQLRVYVADASGQDTSFVSIFDDVAVTGTFTKYGSTYQIQVADPSLHSVSLGSGGLAYTNYQTVQAAWPSTAANPEGVVRVVADYGYTYMVPLPVFLDHPMWGGSPPGPPSDSQGQDVNWNQAAQQALNAWN